MVETPKDDKPLTPAETKKVLLWLAERQKFNSWAYFLPHQKQLDFINAGAEHRERLLMAANRVGKTHVGAFEASCHLTGKYPKWWKGRKWNRPVRCWFAGETSLAVRDVQQTKLCGEPGVDSDFGSGLIPKECFADKPSLARGVTDAYDTIQVRHAAGGISVGRFKSYEQGRAKFQGETLDFVWFDEEPPIEIYAEGLTRIGGTGGMSYMTFTPLKSMSDVVRRFMDQQDPARIIVTMELDDAKHISPEEKAEMIASYQPYEREARSKGIPFLGGGRIFTATEESISEPMIDNVPPHWAKIWGIDFGIDHPFAAVLLLWDKDNDCVHVHHTIRMRDQLPDRCAVPMKAMGASVPVAWPHDGHIRDRGSGISMSKLFKAQGLHMLHEHATWPDGGYSTEAGIMDLQQRMATNRFKVGNHLSEWFEEYRRYHRKEGQIVKKDDDLMSATRIGDMSLRFAKAVPLGSADVRRRIPGEVEIAEGINDPVPFF